MQEIAEKGADVTGRMQAILFRLVPSLVVVALVAFTILGQDGLLQMWSLEAEAARTRVAWGEQERENSRRLLALQHLEADPINLERLVAEELRWVPEDATLYEFDEGVESE